MDGPDEQVREPIMGQEGSTQRAVDGGVFFNMEMSHVLKEVKEGAGAIAAIADDIVGCVTLELARVYWTQSRGKVTKFAYLTSVTPPKIVSPFLGEIFQSVRYAIGEMLCHDLDDAQWGQCLLKPRLDGIGVMDIASTASGA